MILAAILAVLSVAGAQMTVVPTPPGTPVPVPALYGGAGDILQWYLVLSSDASTAKCTALTNAKQSTDADGKPLSPWVLGKLSSPSPSSVSTFNISVDSTDSSVLVLKSVSGDSSLKLKLVSVNTNTTTGTTTLILTNGQSSPWNLVWMLSTSSSQPLYVQYYLDIWKSFNDPLGLNKFPYPISTVPQGATCTYPPGVSPSYFSADSSK